MADNSKRTGPAVEAHYQFLTWLMPTVEKFPRSHKFTIGDRIETAALDVLEALIEATYTRDRLQHLQQANLGIEKLRFLLRTRGRPEIAGSAPLVVHAISGVGGSGKKMRSDDFRLWVNFDVSRLFVSRSLHLRSRPQVGAART